MIRVTEDFVITYDSNFLQEHIDSSDFEECCTPLVETKKGNHNLVKSKSQKMRTRNHPQLQSNNTARLYIDCDEYPVKLKENNKSYSPAEDKCKYSNKRERKHSKNNKEKIDLNRGDQVEPVKSKLSIIIRHKIIPCISSIFKRTNCTKHNMSVIQENHGENTRVDNCCQRCNNCEQRRIRNLYKRQQNYVVQPVYAIEGNVHKTTTGPFASTKITEEPLQHHKYKTKNQYSSYCSLYSSSESDTQCARERQHKVEKFRKRLKSEIMKEHMKYQQIRTSQVHYPSKDNKYQVFMTPIQSRINTQGFDNQCIDKIPSSASSFWEYLFDKTTTSGKKYQTHRVEMPSTCACPVPAPQMQFGRKDTESYGDLTGKGRHGLCDCNCKQGMQQQPQASPYLTQKKSCDPLCTPPRRCDPKCSTDSIAKSSTMDSTIPFPAKADDLKKKKNKVKCQCTEKGKLKGLKMEVKKSQNRFPGSQKLEVPQNQETNIKPCQEGHDKIVSSLAQKYNGEILCIHNPPCILINGCLNLPPQKEQQQQNNDMSFWPITGITKHNIYNQTENANCEQSCQYHVEVNQATDYRAEKIIQSICHHKPPCEVVRGCYKAKYDPQLENSCVHVPMCKQMPECVVVDRKRKCCEHRPRCRGIPICSRDFVILTAKENIGTQVKTSIVNAEMESFICRHEPPCIMIPKCIGSAMCDSSYVNVDAIPGCIHQPSCELIPACCRKSAKEMVSVSSQYPNSCRIV